MATTETMKDLNRRYMEGREVLHYSVHHFERREIANVILIDTRVRDADRYIVIGPHHTGITTFRQLSDALRDVADCLDRFSMVQ